MPTDLRRPNRTFTIRQLCLEFKCTPRALRFYEDKGLLAPARDGLNRVYSYKDRARLQLILRGKRVGLALAEIGEILDLYAADDSGAQQARQESAQVQRADRCAGTARRPTSTRLSQELQGGYARTWSSRLTKTNVTGVAVHAPPTTTRCCAAGSMAWFIATRNSRAFQRGRRLFCSMDSRTRGARGVIRRWGREGDHRHDLTRPPVRDYVFLLRDVLKLERYANLPDLRRRVDGHRRGRSWRRRASFTAEVLAPLNSVGDKRKAASGAADFIPSRPRTASRPPTRQLVDGRLACPGL